VGRGTVFGCSSAGNQGAAGKGQGGRADLAGLAVARAEPRRERLMLHAARRPQCTNSQLPPRHQSETGRRDTGTSVNPRRCRPVARRLPTLCSRKPPRKCREREEMHEREQGRERERRERGFRDCRQDRPEGQPEPAARCLCSPAARSRPNFKISCPPQTAANLPKQHAAGHGVAAHARAARSTHRARARPCRGAR